MQAKLNNKYPILDAVKAEAELAKLHYPTPPDWGRVNTMFNPLGYAPARGCFLLARATLDAIDLNAHNHSLKISDDYGNEIEVSGLVISKEPCCITPGDSGDPAAAYLVEFSDAGRHLLSDPFLGVLINKSYNVRAPAWGGVYYDDSRNSGSDWTWETMVQDLWTTAAALGAFPGLPFTPHGTPEGFKFVGLSVWDALNQVLWRIGCAIAATTTYEIVRIGEEDADADGVLRGAAGRLIYDRQYLGIIKGKRPRKVQVCFHRQEEHYGTEQTTPKIDTQWSTNAIHSEEVTDSPESTHESTVHVLWDDMPALVAVDGTTVTNQSELTARAQERAQDFWRMLMAGGTRRHQIYSGLVRDLFPGSQIKGVSWRQDMTGIGTGRRGGWVTEIINHPFAMLRPNTAPMASPLDGWRENPVSLDMQAPEFGPTYPVYPHLLQLLRIESGPDEDGRYSAYVQQYQLDGTWQDKEQVYLRNPNEG